jgi:hypothetical protein
MLPAISMVQISAEQKPAATQLAGAVREANGEDMLPS